VQHAASEAVPEHPETMALIIVQPEAPVAQLRLQDAILFAKEGITSRCSASSHASAASHIWSGITRQLYRRRSPFQFSDSTAFAPSPM
jgi:hypothetical protein